MDRLRQRHRSILRHGNAAEARLGGICAVIAALKDHIVAVRHLEPNGVERSIIRRLQMSGRIRDKFLTFLIRRPADKGIALLRKRIPVQVKLLNRAILCNGHRQTLQGSAVAFEGNPLRIGIGHKR